MISSIKANDAFPNVDFTDRPRWSNCIGYNGQYWYYAHTDDIPDGAMDSYYLF